MGRYKGELLFLQGLFFPGLDSSGRGSQRETAFDARHVLLHEDGEFSGSWGLKCLFCCCLGWCPKHNSPCKTVSSCSLSGSQHTALTWDKAVFQKHGGSWDLITSSICC